MGRLSPFVALIGLPIYGILKFSFERNFWFISLSPPVNISASVHADTYAGGTAIRFWFAHVGEAEAPNSGLN